jgi:hypothetical protein
MPTTSQAANRMVAQLWTMIAAGSIDVGMEPADVITKLADALDEIDVTYVRDLPLTGFGEADERIDLFVAPGVAVLLDVGPSTPNRDRLRRCALPPGVLALAVLTVRSPDEYPTGHGERHVVHGKFLSVHRIARRPYPGRDLPEPHPHRAGPSGLHRRRAGRLYRLPREPPELLARAGPGLPRHPLPRSCGGVRLPHAGTPRLSSDRR